MIAKTELDYVLDKVVEDYFLDRSLISYSLAMNQLLTSFNCTLANSVDTKEAALLGCGNGGRVYKVWWT